MENQPSNPFANQPGDATTNQNPQNVVANAPATPENQNPNQPEKKSRKKLAIILCSVGGFIILCVAAFLIWWFVYFNNDNSLLSSAFDKLVTNKGGTVEVNMTSKVTATSDGTKSEMTLTANAKGSGSNGDAAADVTVKLAGSGLSLELDGSVFISRNGDVYVKINNLPTLLSAFSSLQAKAGLADSQTSLADYTTMLAPINNKWIKISASDLQNINSALANNLNESLPDASSANLQTCLTNVSNKIVSDKSARQNLLTALKSNDFLNAKRVTKDANGVKYELTINADNAEAFAKNFANTDIAKQITSCFSDNGVDLSSLAKTDSASSSDTSALKNANIHFYFWVDRGSREARRAELDMWIPIDSGSVTVTMTMSNDYQPKTVSAPTDATDLQSVIQNLQGSGLDSESL